ncbi:MULTISPECIES: hypothetical protein [Leptolyngbya]|uniref:hypothetical protein n=1 Tax=Leptolyngbya TaxID=47251 RepID=UPI00168921ED|nr:hypothetical protein [Leptolyngbya sp. FACHB-1624]MBD1854553.1 hypothetical protein [Leptolyngbya sp. FACHB-1624]
MTRGILARLRKLPAWLKRLRDAGMEEKSKLPGFIAPLLEPKLDEIVDDPVVKMIPALSSAVKIAEAGLSVRDRLFLKKIERFLSGLEPTAGLEAQRFAEEIRNGNVQASRTAQTLLLALDKADDLDKAPILAALFQAFLRGEISSAEFRRLTAAVNSAIIDDLRELAELGPNPVGDAKERSELIEALNHTGLTGSASDFTLLIDGGPTLDQAIPPLGKTFVRILERQGQAGQTTGESASSVDEA